MKIGKGLALRLSVLVLSSVTLIFFAVYFYNYIFSRKIIKKNIETNARNLALSTVNRIETVLRSVEMVPYNLASFIEDLSCDDSELMELLRTVVKNNSDIFGATIAFEPYKRHKNFKRFAPYFFKTGNQIDFTFIQYDYFHHDWYQIPKILDRAVWSEPYYDVGGGNTIMTTYSVPFYKRVGNKKRFMGVVTADISLTWLQKIVSSIKIGKTGYGFLITQNGTFVTHPESRLIMNETIFTLAEERNDRHLRKIGRRMIRGLSGYDDIKSMVTGKDCWLVYEPLPSSGWSLGVLFPKEELLADIKRLNKTVLVLGIIGFILLFIVIIYIAGSITKPIRALSKATENIAKGNLNAKIPGIKSKDEVGHLAESFQYMQDSLKRYIEELTKTVAEKERIESELKIARKIQEGILPKRFPPFPEKEELDLYAVLEPAREVGGDFYDFFLIDENHLCMVIGDVSDKGVPAALFMSVTKTLIKAKATQGLEPENILTRVNEDLVLNNPSLMFVTLFLCILDINSGKLTYSNGGHNPPLILRRAGQIETLPLTGDMALGVMENIRYSSKEMILQPGDTIFLYTDGVTEAMNEKGDFFSETRLKELLLRFNGLTSQSLIEKVLESIKEFSKGCLQSDDITMLALKYGL